MSFLWVNALWLLVLVPIAVAVYVLLQRRRQRYALRYASLSLIKEALGKGPAVRRHIPPALFIVGLAILLVGIARPVATISLPSEQGTVILTIDASGSMRADDIKPSRLEAAKAAALLFVQKQAKNVRIGVVSFAATASLVQQPTTDREAVNAAIRRLQTGRNTAIGSGIVTSLEAIFEKPGGQPSNAPNDQLGAATDEPENTTVAPGNYAPAAIILLSDGASNTGPRPQDVVRQAVDRGVRIYTVGVGSAAGTILNVEGMAMRVRLDEEVLKQISEKTDGMYFLAGTDTDLNKVYEDLGTRIVFRAERTEVTAFFVAGALVFLLISAGLSLMWFHRLP